MTDKIVLIKNSIDKNFTDFNEIAGSELQCVKGSVDKLRYQSVRATLKNAAQKTPELTELRLFDCLNQNCVSGKINLEFFNVLFEQYCEAIIFCDQEIQTDFWGDKIPSLHTISKLENRVNHFESIIGGHGCFEFWKGIIYHLKGEDYLCAQVMQKAHFMQSTDYRIPHYLTGASTCVIDPDNLIKSNRLYSSKISPVELIQSSKTDYSLVLYSCADQKYIKHLGPKFFESVKHFGPDTLLHLNVIISDKSEIDGIKKNLPGNMDISVSYNIIPKNAPKAAYTMIRFLTANDILKIHRKPILITDFDIEFIPDSLNGYIKLSSGHDVGLNINPYPQNRFPWTTINANQVFIRPNKKGKEFAELLYKVSANIFDDQKDGQWWIDQNALFSVYRIINRSRAKMRIFNNFDHKIKNTIKNKKVLLEGKADA